MVQPKTRGNVFSQLQRQGSSTSGHKEERRTEVSAPPRRVPTLYPTSPPAGIAPEATPAKNDRPIAHSLRPKKAPVTLESIQEQRSSAVIVEESVSEQTLYALFEVHPSVSEDELRRSYKRLWACFHPDHFAGYGLYTRAQLEALLERFQSSFELLMDPERRQAYDAETFPDGIPELRGQHAETPSRLSPSFQPLIVRDEAKVAWRDQGSGRLGESLRRLREKFNLSLSAVHERSKISLTMLGHIENDDFEHLPAEVYLRGFIRELAQLYAVTDLVDLEGYLRVYREHQVSKKGISRSR